MPLEVIGKMVLEPQSGQFLRRDRAGRLSSRPCGSGHRFLQRSAAAGTAVLLHRYPAHPVGRTEFPRAGDQSAALPDAEFPARRRSSARTCPPDGWPTSPTASTRKGRGKIRPPASSPIATQESGDKVRLRPESFADHYSQARMFFRSMAEPEQRHIVSAFAFELGKVETIAIRKRMLGHLMIIEPASGRGGRGGAGDGRASRPDHPGARAHRHGRVAGAEPDQEGAAHAAGPQDRGAGDGRRRRGRGRAAAQGGGEGRRRARRRRPQGRRRNEPAGRLAACGSRAVGGALHLLRRGRPDAVGGRLRAAGPGSGRGRLVARCLRPPQGHRLRGGGRAACSRKRAVPADDGVVALEGREGIAGFIAAAKRQRIWEREPGLRSPG